MSFKPVDIILLLVLFFLQPPLSKCNDSTRVISGVVLDKQSGGAILGAHIIINGKLVAISNQFGAFNHATNLKTVKLRVQSIGYGTYDSTIICSGTDTVAITVFLLPSSTEMDPVFVSANKFGQRKSELTSSTSILQPKMCMEKLANHADQIIDNISGIDINDGQASIRGGSGYSYGAGSRVMVLIDGLPVLSKDANKAQWDFLPLENLEQIEIIKGASSVLYGSSALNGIINLRTRYIGEIPETRVNLKSGGYGKPKNKNWIWWDTPRFFYDLSFFHGKQLHYSDFIISGNYYNDKGYRTLNYDELFRVSTKYRRRPLKHPGLIYGININAMDVNKQDFLLWQDADTGALVQNPDGALELKGYRLAIDPFINFQQTEKVQHAFLGRFHLTSNQYPMNSDNDSRAISQYFEYRINYIPNTFLYLVSGIAGSPVSVNSNFYNNHSGINLALYGQATSNILPRLKAESGVRFELDRLDGVSDRITPIFRFGLNYRVFKSAHVRGSFGQGYRYPSIAEKFGNTTVGTIKIIPNPEVKPESGWNAEIGFDQGFKKGRFLGGIDIALFRMQNNDLIEYTFGLFYNEDTGDSDFGFKALNIENARITGTEAQIMGLYKKGKFELRFNGGYTYIYPVEYNKVSRRSTERFLNYRNKHSLKFYLSARHKRNMLGLNIVYRSKILNINPVFLNEQTSEEFLPGFAGYWPKNNTGYMVIDCNYHFSISNKIDLGLAVRNLSNTISMKRPGDIDPPRNYSMQVVFDF